MKVILFISSLCDFNSEVLYSIYMYIPLMFYVILQACNIVLALMITWKIQVFLDTIYVTSKTIK